MRNVKLKVKLKKIIKMKNLKLLPHNQQAVDKTMFHFKSGAQRAAIIHPTGTGKSYCIAAVAQQFNKVAVILT